MPIGLLRWYGSNHPNGTPLPNSTSKVQCSRRPPPISHFPPPNPLIHQSTNPARAPSHRATEAPKHRPLRPQDGSRTAAGRLIGRVKDAKKPVPIGNGRQDGSNTPCGCHTPLIPPLSCAKPKETQHFKGIQMYS